MKYIQRIAAFFSVVAIFLAAYFLIFRPAQLHLGATDAEIRSAMTGDEIEPKPTFLATRAITLNATPEQIWPWLIQMGYDRAGFYGYDIIEGIGSKTGMISAERIIPELQNAVVGDTVPISAAGAWQFHAIEKPRYFIWSGYKEDGTPDGGFIWALRPIDAEHTRLISRVTWRHHFHQPSVFVMDMFTEFTDHIAMRKIFEGLQARVEGRELQSFRMQTAEFFYYVAMLLFFLAALARLLLRELTLRRYLFAIAAAALMLIAWYTPLHPILGMIALIAATVWYWKAPKLKKLTPPRLWDPLAGRQSG